MNTTNNKTEKSQSKEENQRIDWFLQTLVSLVNSSKKTSFPITLCIGGGLISGWLIGGKEYFKLYTEVLRRGIPTPEQEQEATFLLNTIEGLGDTYERPLDDQNISSLSYIHLKEARFAMGNNVTPLNEGILWRGRISAVDGFWPGGLRQD